jgi:hypothetical protein
MNTHAPFCPACKVELDMSEVPRMRLRPAEPGDLTLCSLCGVLLMFTAGMGVRRLTRAEFSALTIGERASLAVARGRLRLPVTKENPWFLPDA